MGSEGKYLRFGLVLIGGALAIRLMTGGAVSAVLSRPEVLPMLLFLETGRYAAPRTESPPAPETQPPPETTVPPAPQEKPAFTGSDAELITMNNVCGYSVDVKALLQKPLRWDLTQDGPAVLIVHSHGTESYEKNGQYQESSAYRTRDSNYNVVSMGDRIAQILENGGIGVVHDRTAHDDPSYNKSYANSRASIKAYMDKYPSIRMVLDIHRDSVTRSDGTQAAYTVTRDGQKIARIMLVVGTDANGNHHPNWEENMALAVKLHAQLEKTTPGITRTISFRKQRFNQDLSTGSMLIEVGAAGNTHQEALLGAEQVALGILALAKGANDGVY